MSHIRKFKFGAIHEIDLFLCNFSKSNHIWCISPNKIFFNNLFYTNQFPFLAILPSMSLSDALHQAVLFYDAIKIFQFDALYHTDILIWMHFTIQIYSLYSYNIRCSFLYSPSEHPPPPRRVLQELLLSDNCRVCVRMCVSV